MHINDDIVTPLRIFVALSSLLQAVDLNLPLSFWADRRLARKKATGVPSGRLRRFCGPAGRGRGRPGADSNPGGRLAAV